MINPDQIFGHSLSFEEKSLAVFQFQQKYNPVYGRFCQALGTSEITSIAEIPLLPVEAFRDANVIISPNSQITHSQLPFFQSSGTTGMKPSRHYLLNPEIYRQSVLRGIQQFYNPDDFVIWAYVPGYAENPHSSLIKMLQILIEHDKTGRSRFLELNTALDVTEIKKVSESGKKLMLFGAAFGLLDLIDLKKIKLPEDSVIIETGGMKTFRREISKYDLHQQLSEGFGLPKHQIHSEYGMAELLSQAYSLGDEWFHGVPWMKCSIRNPDNPFEEMPMGEEGIIGVMDLANFNSCSFILTGDKGLQREDGAFQVLGRWNPKDLRGCNFLIDRD